MMDGHGHGTGYGATSLRLAFECWEKIGSWF